jgi:hypothetical protein
MTLVDTLAKWETAARRAAMKVPELAAKVVSLEARIRQHKNSQAELMDRACYQRRSLDRSEGSAFDSLEANIDECSRRLRAIYRQCLAPPR